MNRSRAEIRRQAEDFVTGGWGDKPMNLTAAEVLSLLNGDDPANPQGATTPPPNVPPAW